MTSTDQAPTMDGGSWQAHIDHVRAKGVLAKPLFVILTTPVGTVESLQAQLGAHLAYQKDLEACGITFAAGPFADDSGREWSGEGMIIVRAASLAEAQRIAEADPMHQSGLRRYRIRPWLLNEGSYTVTVRYSEQHRSVL
ncbi:MAG: YciI family protein [Rubrivivax sp.]|nr:YciI family protein [Rubrivivax sp.]